MSTSTGNTVFTQALVLTVSAIAPPAPAPRPAPSEQGAAARRGEAQPAEPAVPAAAQTSRPLLDGAKKCASTKPARIAPLPDFGLNSTQSPASVGEPEISFGIAIADVGDQIREPILPV